MGFVFGAPGNGQANGHGQCKTTKRSKEPVHETSVQRGGGWRMKNPARAVKRDDGAGENTIWIVGQSPGNSIRSRC